MIPLKGELVTLEPLDIGKHAKGYFKAAQDEKMHTYVGNTVPKTVEEVEETFRLYEKLFLNWMIVLNETQEVIGILRLSKPQRENSVLSAGESQRLVSDYWRKGHMKEAKKLFYPYVFDTLGVEVLYADVWAENVNSVKSLESYGYRRLETIDAVFPKTGKPMQQYIYALSAEDYQRKTK